MLANLSKASQVTKSFNIREKKFPQLNVTLSQSRVIVNSHEFVTLSKAAINASLFEAIRCGAIIHSCKLPLRQ